MRRLRVWGARLAGLMTGRRREEEFAEEVESHLQMHIEENLRSGMTPEEARRDALLKFGGVAQVKEAYREGNSVPFLENLSQDGRFAIRQLRKNPGFTGTAIFILALGLCASVSIFAFVDAALLKPLPYQAPERLLGVFETVPMFEQSNLSYQDYLDWKQRIHSFGSLEVFQRSGYSLRTAAGAEMARGARVSDGFFRTLGVTPILGRDFYAGEDLPSAPNTALLSYASWQNRYGGKPEVLGQSVILDGTPTTIVGVLPREFHFAPVGAPEFWVTLHATGGCFARRSCHSLYGVARLRDGVAVETALAEAKAVAKQLEQEYPDSNRDQGANVVALGEVIVGEVRPILFVLLGGAGLLLLIACVNVASLLLVRSESRKREFAVRTALGASTGRLACQFATEGVLLVAVGGLLGLVAARWVMRLLVRLVPEDLLTSMPFLHDLGISGRVLAFAVLLAAFTAALFSFIPSLALSEVRDGLAEGGRGAAGTIWRRVGARLVMLELATAVVLLVGASLLGQSLYYLLRVNVGFQPERLATITIAAPDATYAKEEQSIALARKLLDRIRSLPGVKSAGLSANGLPVSGNGNTTWLRVLGRPWHGEHYEVPLRDVSAEYFTTLEARLLRGRFFAESEDTTKPRVAIINQAMAREYFPNEDPLGKQLAFISTSPLPMEIVGIVEDIKQGPLETATPPVLYLPFNQDAGTYFDVVVRTSQSEQALLPALTRVVREIDPEILTKASTMRDLIRDSPSAYLHRSSAWLVGGFAALALLLSVVGLYGVVAYSVSQRTREIGVRMALGARQASVYLLVLKEAGRLAVVGIAVGLGGGVGIALLMRKLLFGVQSWDLPTLATVAIVLAVCALLASYLPARRAAMINPVEALRTE